MPTKLIEFDDQIQVEVFASENEMRTISGGVTAKFSETIDQIEPVLMRACKPLANVWQELNKEMSVKEANVAIQLGFSASGNVFIAKGSANANLTVSLKMTPKTD